MEADIHPAKLRAQTPKKGSERTTIQVVIPWRLVKMALVASALALLPALTNAQGADSITGNAGPAAAPAAMTMYEQVVIKALGAPVTLRCRGVHPNTDSVTLDGQPLTRGADYTVEYAGGLLYLYRQVNLGQTLRISYQYDKESQPGYILGQSQGIRRPQSALSLGMPATALYAGATPHLSAVAGSDLYGWNSTFQFGSLGLNGLILFSNMSNPTAGGLTNALGGSRIGPVDSQFILQNVTAKLSKGTVQFDLQSISPNFNGFDSVRAAGYDSNIVDQLQKEAGLKRIGVSLQNVSVGALKVNSSIKSVQDDSGSINWKTLTVENGGLKLAYRSQNIGLGFTRFQDLAETDREKLMAQAGISRQSLTGEYKTKVVALGYSANRIKDEFGQSIAQRDLKFDSGKWKLSMGDESVDAGFTRFDNLPDPERDQWAKEQGVKRQYLSLETPPLGRGGQPVKVAINDQTSSTGSLKAEDVTAGGKNWSLAISERKVDSQFNMTTNLTDAAVDQNVQAIAKMYQPTGITTGAGDRAAFLQGPGVDRQAFRFTANPLKDWNFDFEAVKLTGAMDYANLQAFAMSAKNFDVSVKREHEGVNFVEAPLLFGFEQQRLGVIPGLTKQDIVLNWRLGGFKKLSYSSMESDTTNGAAKREALAYSDKKIELSISDRTVDPGFANVGSLADSDAGLLAMLTGFKERDIKAKWQILPNLKFETLWEDQRNESQNLNNYTHNLSIVWDPNKTTHLAYTYLDTKSDNPLDVLFQSRTSNLQFSKDFGRYGKLLFFHENDAAENTNTTAAPGSVAAPQGPAPDPGALQGNSTKDYVSYEAKLDKNTSVKTEESRTEYADGSKEAMSANTISRSLTDHFGLSYTDLRLARSGLDHDETKHNYGVWFDLAKGVRFSYGFVRDDNNMLGNTWNSTVGITPGNVGLLHIDSVQSATNGWDLHNQVTSNYQLKSSKPIKLGFISDFQFNVGMDTASDYSTFQRDNRIAGVSGKVGSNSFMVEYKSVLDPSGFHGIDKFLKFETDQSDKRWLKASIKVKQRETPTEGMTLIRDYSVTLKPVKNLEITNQMLTNPEEQFRSDVLMGSLTSPWRVNRYKLDYHSGKDTTIGGTYEDRFNDLTRDFSRTAGLDVELFKSSGSPLTLWYGLEQASGSLTPKQTMQRYYIKYFQKAGPNQVFNLFAGNISYDYISGTGFSRNNWTLHLDYEYRFW